MPDSWEKLQELDEMKLVDAILLEKRVFLDRGVLRESVTIAKDGVAVGGIRKV